MCKYSLDKSHTFKGPPNIHLVRSIIVKACEARMDPTETCQKRKFHLPALAELLFMLARIWVLELLYDAMAMAAT